MRERRRLVSVCVSLLICFQYSFIYWLCFSNDVVYTAGSEVTACHRASAQDSPRVHPGLHSFPFVLHVHQLPCSLQQQQQQQQQEQQRPQQQQQQESCLRRHTRYHLSSSQLLPGPGRVLVDTDHEAVVHLARKAASTALRDLVDFVLASGAVDLFIRAMLVLEWTSFDCELTILLVGRVAEGTLEEQQILGDASGVDVAERSSAHNEW